MVNSEKSIALLQRGVAPAPPRAGVRLRKITEADLPAVAQLLTEGFRNRSPRYWLRGLARHANRPRPAEYPTFGYCLEKNGELVGAILLLFSSRPSANGIVVRCNVSSWYVKPEFRSYGSLLVTSATKDKKVTYFNISPAPHTWSTVEAQGFSTYCKGRVYALPFLSRPIGAAYVLPFTAAASRLSADEYDLLRQHASFGCFSVVVRDDGVDHPFVFQRDRVRGLVPVYRLMYCQNIEKFARYAGNLGRFLLARGVALVRFDANQPVSGIIGWYSEKRARKYAKGSHPPHLGDLAFTEAALFDS